jgi:hypothetical protein
MMILSKIQLDHNNLEDVDIWGETHLTAPTSKDGQLL